jgi:hypothetical protein
VTPQVRPEIVRVEKRGPLSADAVGRDVADFIERLRPTALRLADGHASKLRMTYGLFLLAAVIGFGAIAALIACDWHSPSYPPWPYRALVAGLGGWLGGLARAVYFFSFDAYAFNHRYRTRESSKWAVSRPVSDGASGGSGNVSSRYSQIKVDSITGCR